MEKQTLVKLKTSAWHYKFLSWTLGSLAPTPSNMFNLCPYFWLLVFSLIMSPFIVIGRSIRLFFNTLETYVDRKFLIPSAEEWYRNLTADRICEEWDSAYYPGSWSTYLKRLNKGYDDMFKEFYEADTGKKIDSIHCKEFWDWTRDIRKKRLQNKRLDLVKEKLSDKIVNTISKKWSEFTKSISNWNTIIKWTKRTVGLVITVVGLFLTYFVVSFITKGTIWLIINWDWIIFGIVILGIIGIVIFVFILYACNEWVKYMRQNGIKLWYVKILYYVIGLPISYVFYHFLWKLIAVQLIWGALKALGRGFLSFLGIFGEYFGASYTDYCPGIEWEEE